MLQTARNENLHGKIIYITKIAPFDFLSVSRTRYRGHNHNRAIHRPQSRLMRLRLVFLNENIILHKTLRSELNYELR